MRVAILEDDPDQSELIRHWLTQAEHTTESYADAAGFLRAKLGQAIKVRHVPELRFEHDDSAAEGQRITDLIDGALKSDASH